MITFKLLIQEHSELFQEIQGPVDLEFFSIQPPELSSNQSACFISNSEHWKSALQTDCRNWIVVEKFLNSIPAESRPSDRSLLSCKNIQIAMAIVLKYFDSKLKYLPFTKGISPLAFIHPSCEMGKNITIAPFTTIGPNVKIGDNTIVGPHCTIEGNVSIGTNTWLESHVYIGYNSIIGNHCQIKPFAAIAGDGYGYAPKQGDILKIPQVGKVVIEDYVDIGANTCIDRATITETRIGKGTKLDNLIHIAHNCRIGNYCMLTAGFATAGSTTIDDYFICGGRVAVADHVYITKNVTLAGASIVTNDINEPGAYGGSPLQPMTDFLKTKSSIASLPILRKQMNKVLKHLGLTEK